MFVSPQELGRFWETLHGARDDPPRTLSTRFLLWAVVSLTAGAREHSPRHLQVRTAGAPEPEDNAWNAATSAALPPLRQLLPPHTATSATPQLCLVLWALLLFPRSTGGHRCPSIPQLTPPPAKPGKPAKKLAGATGADGAGAAAAGADRGVTGARVRCRTCAARGGGPRTSFSPAPDIAR